MDVAGDTQSKGARAGRGGQVAVPTRRIAFRDALGDVPRHFAADGDLLLSHFAAGLSALFPDGEDFFVRSVRHFRDDVTDPELRRRVAGFIGQEATHGREHRVLNDRLAQLGYPTKFVERLVRAGLALRSRLAPPKANLAVTAALEHFTATLAELLLTSPEAQRLFGDDNVRDLFLWHALEELEHKDVAFDVYRTVGGGERMRILTMKFVRAGFVVVMVAQLVLSLALDPASYRPRRLWRSWRRFLRSPVMSREVWDRLRAYDRRGFHPNDLDTSALVAEWRERLFGASGTLNDKLVAPAA
jgi:predicted metal-dependent hydrolase